MSESVIFNPAEEFAGYRIKINRPLAKIFIPSH